MCDIPSTFRSSTFQLSSVLTPFTLQSFLILLSPSPSSLHLPFFTDSSSFLLFSFFFSVSLSPSHSFSLSFILYKVMHISILIKTGQEAQIFLALSPCFPLNTFCCTNSINSVTSKSDPSFMTDNMYFFSHCLLCWPSYWLHCRQVIQSMMSVIWDWCAFSRNRTSNV